MSKLFNIKGDPFAKLSAEEEREYLTKIFYKQRYYDSLLGLAEDSVSRFVLGQRGQGKSATILHLFEDMKSSGYLPVLIDRYDGYPLQDNKNYFLYSMIQALTFKLAKNLMDYSFKKKNLNSSQKEQLAFFIEAFYDKETAEECIYQADIIRNKRCSNKVKAWINNHLSFLNGVLDLSIKVGVDLIKSVLKMDNVDISSTRKEYIGELQIEQYHSLSMSEIVQWDTSKLIKVLKNLIEIACAMNCKSVVVMFDKIDEVPGINADIEKVTTFMYDFLTDNNLLYTSKLSIVVSLWSEVKKSLNKRGVRFDKFKEIDIRWTNEELVEMMNKRLLYYSVDKKTPVTLSSLVTNENQLAVIMELADRSPRYLINLLGYILYEEHTNNVREFSVDALTKGYMMYCRKFDYVSAQPSRTGKGSDLTAWITRLLRIKLSQFTLEQYMAHFNLKKNTALKHIETLIQFNLIRDSLYQTDNGDIKYEVCDPRIKYLITRGVQDLD